MAIPPRLRKFALTVHITASVSWLGMVVGFLALAVAGLVSHDALSVRSAYLAMQLTAWYVILPLSIAALLTGVVQGLGTPWGLFRHYWVVIKLGITVLCTLILLVHLQPISHLAHVAAASPIVAGDELRTRIQMVIAAVAAVVALVVATGLSVYKPRGLTPYGQHKRRKQRATVTP